MKFGTLIPYQIILEVVLGSNCTCLLFNEIKIWASCGMIFIEDNTRLRGDAR